MAHHSVGSGAGDEPCFFLGLLDDLLWKHAEEGLRLDGHGGQEVFRLLIDPAELCLVAERGAALFK